jgi:thiosulfate/3-mercaptopyruvate sulfurtransferase
LENNLKHMLDVKWTMPYTTLIDTEALVKHLNDPAWVIFDCRFDLMHPEAGYEEYLDVHIPGAIYADLNKHLASIPTPQTGRHPLPDTEIFVQLLSSWGVDSTKQVVVYDGVGGAFAARLWFLLSLYGHEAVAVLNGGFNRWAVEDRPLSSEIPAPKPSQFIAHHNPRMVVTTEEMVEIQKSQSKLVLDARSGERYRGENEPIDPVAGHIPGAINRFHGLNLNKDATIRPLDELKTEFTQLLGQKKPSDVILYCGSGVTSIHHMLIMEAVGLTGSRLYAGSWSEWIRDPSRPVAVGPNP